MLKIGRRVIFEYCLIDGVNDGASKAHELARILRGLNCHVNLIPYNSVDELGFQAPLPNRVRAFREILDKSCIQATERLRRGPDIDAVCGQLRQETERMISINQPSISLLSKPLASYSKAGKPIAVTSIIIRFTTHNMIIRDYFRECHNSSTQLLGC